MSQCELLLNPSVAAEDEAGLSEQQRLLLARLRRGPLTNVQAVTEMHVLNLTARVSELRQAGYVVTAKRVPRSRVWTYTLGVR